MPFLQPPPPGFHGAAAAMEKLEPKALASLVTSCVLARAPPDAAAYAMGAEELGGLVNALKFVFKTATKGNVPAVEFGDALTGAGVESERAQALQAVWEKKGAKAVAAYEGGAVALPELTQFDWKLGVSMASSDWCVESHEAGSSHTTWRLASRSLPPRRRWRRLRRSVLRLTTRSVCVCLHSASLSTGFVTIQLHVKNPDGSTTPHAFELSLQEFDEFAKQWAQIGQLMEANTTED